MQESVTPAELVNRGNVLESMWNNRLTVKYLRYTYYM